GNEYGVTRELEVSVTHLTEQSHFRVQLHVKAVEEIQKTALVVSIEDSSGLRQYNAFELKQYSILGEWVFMEFGSYIQIKSDHPLKMKVYCWDPGKQDKVLIDNLNIDLMVVSED